MSGNYTRNFQVRKLKCHYCNSALATTSDHIVPKVLGGPQGMWNIQPSCASCNGSKKDDWPDCTCKKCQDAVTTFLQDPYRTEKALQVLTNRRNGFDKVLTTIIEVKIPSVIAIRNQAAQELENLEALILKARYPFAEPEIS